MPRVSVIVPIYNCESCLRDCLDSILAQRFRDFELILVDDGSTDGCGRIIDEYAAGDARVKAVHKINGGPASARNAGLEEASAPYVYFSDSDDLWDPSLLEKAIPEMDAGYEMAVFGFRMDPPDQKGDSGMTYEIRERRELLLEDDKEKYDFITGPFRRRAIRWEVWNRIFRRDIIEKYGIRFGDDRRVFAEDMYFTYFYLSHISRIILLPDILYVYRKRTESVSSNYKKHLMIFSSNYMTEQYYAHCGRYADCRYLYAHFLPIYYLLHKGAIRRLRRYQWTHGLTLPEAREILRDNVTDYPGFLQKMRSAYSSPAVRESYRKDKNRLLQLTDRLYTAELLEIPCPGVTGAARKALLEMLRLLSADRRSSAVGPPAGRSGEGKEKR